MSGPHSSISTTALVLVAIASAACFIFSIPRTAFADGSQSYTSPGSYSFVVPAYGTLTVTVRGSGGGGSSSNGYYNSLGTKVCGSSSFARLCTWTGGSSGGYSGFNSNSVVAYGGTGAPGYPDPTRPDTMPPPSTGSPGGGYGGTVTSGGGAAGGAGGGCGSAAYCGAVGGSGGMVVTAYAAGALTPGASVSVVVGSGAAGGAQYGPDAYGNYNWPGGTGTNGSVAITWTTAVPTCSINASPTTINQPSGSALTWSSANATTFYITSVGYVTANVSGGATVYPTASITYTGTATGPGGTTNCSRTVTVNRSCTFNGNTVLHGGSVTAYQASTVPYGNSCTSQTRTCTDGTLSGTYAYASCSVTPAANCTFNGNTVVHGASVTAYQASSVPYGSLCSSQSRSCSNGTLSGTYAYASCSVTPAANCTLDGVTVLHGASRTFYTQQTAPVGQTCSAISQSRTCTNGTLSGTASYQYASCLCAPIYSCSGNDIRYTNSACSTSTVATCSAPGYCVAGQSTCQYDDIGFTSFSATTSTAASGISGVAFTATGHLEARPALVRSGDRSRLYWNVSSAESCTVTSTNGDSWTQTSTPSWGVLTSPITSMARFTLVCTAYPTVIPASVEETVSVLPSPEFSEQ